MKRGAFLLTLVSATIYCGCIARAQEVFINAIHYDNAGADTGEAIEIAGQAGLSLSAYEVIFYNGTNGREYGSMGLSGTLPNHGDSGFGALSFPFEGIQNGAPDGVALYHAASDKVIQLLSYEGVMTASGGAADGMESEDIGVRETSSTPKEASIQLTGTGFSYEDFSWQLVQESSFGSINDGQAFEGEPGATGLILTIWPSRLVESSGATAEVSVFVSPPPGEPMALSITIATDSAPPPDLEVPTTVELGADGTGFFEVSVHDNAIDDGDREVVIKASDPAGALEAGETTLTIVDDDRMLVKGEAVRVASFNLLNDTGDRGSSSFKAVAASLSRIEPDVIAFQEVDSINDFGNLKLLLGDIAFPTDDAHFARADDQFRGEPYNGGDFNIGEQSLAIASRYPIKRVSQIGRDAPDHRREITRFPLYVEIDIPWADDDDDLHVICVHYKAGTRDSDRFRKGVEAYRTLEFLEAEGISGNTHNVLVLGDFNENSGNFQPGSFNTGRTTFGDGSSLPGGFQVGDDIAGENALTIPYDSFPRNLFRSRNFDVLTARHSDRSAINTFIPADGVRLDYMIASRRLDQNGNRFTEVFNSELDAAFDGIPKQGQPVRGNTSRVASDHYPLYGDYWVVPADRLTVSFSTAAPTVDEASTVSAKASIVLTPAPAGAQIVTVCLSSVEGDDLEMPATVTVTGPAKSVDFQVSARRDGRADRDRLVTLIARADGYATGYGRVFVNNANASGRLLISQYVQGKDTVLEFVNASGERIDFAKMPAEIRIYSDGDTSAQRTIRITTGALESGQTLVSGSLPVADGNDAIEIVLGGVRSDVFGRVGENPGEAWEGGGLSTANTNLALKDSIAVGSSGWSDPSVRFRVAHGAGLVGFGEPPALSDPYSAWASGLGLSIFGDGHPDADLDGDSLTNASEFAFATHPLRKGPHSTAGIDPDSVPVMLRRPDDGRVQYTLQSSGDMVTWEDTRYFEDGAVTHDDGRERVRAIGLLKIFFAERYFRFSARVP